MINKLYTYFKDGEMSDIVAEKEKIKGIKYYLLPKKFNSTEDRVELVNGKFEFVKGGMAAFKEQQEQDIKKIELVDSIRPALKDEISQRIRTMNNNVLADTPLKIQITDANREIVALIAAIHTRLDKLESDIKWMQQSQNFQDVKQTFSTDTLSDKKDSDYEYGRNQYEESSQQIKRKNALVERYHNMKKELIAGPLSDLEEYIAQEIYLQDDQWPN
jgi:tetrahydromethanopterin S-methyltransferase subunit G